MNVSDLTPIHTVEDLDAEVRGDDPYLALAHRDVPLEDGDDMCDDCPYCSVVCGDGEVDE